VLASANQNKYLEIKKLLKPLRGALYTASDLGCTERIFEIGNSFEENAIIKARFVTSKLKVLALADDSGLLVKALNGSPGLYSARYAGLCADDLCRNSKLLQEMNGIPFEHRQAIFVCVIVCYRLDGAVLTSHGYLEGRIAFKAYGKNGFGYDPIFELPTQKLTLAMLNSNEKNIVSHRAEALRKLIPKINNFVKGVSVGV